MSTFESRWARLKRSKEFREEFAIAMLKRMVPFQIKAIRKRRPMSQVELAESAKLTQGVISRAEDPDYGNLTLNTIGRIAAGFDLAFVGKFVPFSHLVHFEDEMSESEFALLPTFEQEDRVIGKGRSSANVVMPERFEELREKLGIVPSRDSIESLLSAKKAEDEDIHRKQPTGDMHASNRELAKMLGADR